MANLEGIKMKHTVIKNDDIEKLDHSEKISLGHIAEIIEDNRATALDIERINKGYFCMD